MKPETFSLTAPGPIAEAFMNDRSFVSAIMGPIGSAKTSTCIGRLWYSACQQAPSPQTGERYSRWVCIRDTYRNLNRSLIASYFKRVPREWGEFRDGGGNGPSLHRIRARVPGVGIVNTEFLFAAVADQDVEAFCRGFEFTGGYLNEMDLLPPDLLPNLLSRAGRYPDMDHGGATWRGAIGDLNAPDTDSWFYNDFVAEPRTGYRLFVQPGGMTAGAENRHNLPADYYERLCEGQPDWWVRRFVHNQWGFSRAGQPVYPEWRDAWHCSPAPLPVADRRLVIGLDQGLRGAATFWQTTTLGQWRCLDELLAADSGEGATRFAQRLAALLAERFRGLPIEAWADPAGWARDSDEQTWASVVARVAGIKIRPAPTNTPAARWEAVRLPLTRVIDGGQPGLLIDPRCRVLRRGFNAGYRFKRIRTAGRDHYDVTADKTVRDADVHDSAQYALLGGGEFAEVSGRKARIAAGQAPVIASTDFSLFR